jgi:hypothetical protein
LLNAAVAAHLGAETPEELDENEALSTADIGSPNGIPSLDSGGKIPASQLPALAIPEVSVVANAAARLALFAQEGDEAIQTDDGSNWIFDGTIWIARPVGGGIVGPGSALDRSITVFDGTSGNTVAASGATISAGGATSLPGSLSTGGVVNGRDTAADGTKLDAIEAGATTDQSASEVPFTPAGDLTASNVQAAIVEVRDDTDTKLAGKLSSAHAGSGGSAHANATTSTSGFLSAPDKTKLDAVVERLRATITQPSHGISLTNNVPVPVYKNGLGLWVASQADSVNTLCAAHVVNVVDTNTFELQQLGFLTATGHSLVVGEYYFLSQASAGGILVAEADTGISEVLWYVVDSNTLLLMDNRSIDLDTIQKYQATLRNTNTTTNLNGNSAVEVPLSNQVRNDADFYTFVGNGIRIDTAGTYQIKASLHVTANVTRANLLVRFYINDSGNGVGAIAASGYIRNGSGHNESSFYLEDDFTLLAGDVVTVKTTREAAGGNVSMAVVESSYLKVIKQ